MSSSRLLSLRLAAVTLAAFAGCDNTPPPDNRPAGAGSSDPMQDAATELAQKSLPHFVQTLQAGAASGASNFSVRLPVVHQERVEYLWMSVDALEGDNFKGRISNDPSLVGNVVKGQAYSVNRSTVADWMYFQNGRMHGNYTARVMLDTMPPEEASRLRGVMAPLPK